MKLTVTGNSAKTSDKSDFETTITHNPCQAGIPYFCFLEFLASGTTAIFKRTGERVNEMKRGKCD